MFILRGNITTSASTTTNKVSTLRIIFWNQVGEDLMEFHQTMVVGAGSGQGDVADDGWSTSIPQVTQTTPFHPHHFTPGLFNPIPQLLSFIEDKETNMT